MEFEPNQMVINEGEDGNNLYLIDEGTLKCTKKDK